MNRMTRALVLERAAGSKPELSETLADPMPGLPPRVQQATRSHGFIVGHVTPEAQEGGPIALVRDGDRISIDAKQRSIDLEVSEAEMQRRRSEFRPPSLKARRGTLYKYIKNVRPASEGCVTDE